MVDNDVRVERVARAMCESDGKNPDGEKLTGRSVTTTSGNTASRSAEKIPAWREYELEAVKFLAALDAAGGHVGNG